MNVTDYIIDTSQNEEEAMKKIADRAAAEHGSMAVGAIIDNDQFSPDEAKAALIRMSQTKKPKPPTMEEDLGFNRAYDALWAIPKVVGPLIKPITTPLAGILETATEGPSAGLRAMGEDITQLEPSAKGSFAYQLGKIPALNKPIMNTPAQDVQEKKGMFDLFSPKTRAAAKLYLQQEFPKTYGALSNASPATLIGGAADIGAGEFMGKVTSPIVKKGLGVAGDKLIGSAIRSSEKAIERMSSLSGENAAEASNTLKTQKAAMTAMEYGLTDRLKDPVALSEALNGTKEIIPDQLKGKSVRKASKGLIDNLTDNVNGIADEVSLENEPINVKSIANKVYNEVSDKVSDPNSGATWNSNVANRIKETVDNFFKNTPHDLHHIADEVKSGNIDKAIEMQNSYNTQNKRDFKSLIKLKRAAADKVYEINKNPEIYGVEGATDKAIFKEIWDQIDNKINSMAKNADPKLQKFVQINSDLSDMLHLKNMTQKARVEGLASLSLPEMALGTAAATTAAGALGHPMMGLAYTPARAAMKMGETNIPAYVAPVQESLGKIAYGGVTGENSLAKLPGRTVGASIGLTSNPNVASYKIPMNTELAIQNTQLVSSKIRREFGDKTAQMFEGARSVEEVRSLFRILHQQNPNAFEQSKYNNIDGFIDPIYKGKAINDIVTDKVSPAHVNADRMQTLLHEGKTTP